MLCHACCTRLPHLQVALCSYDAVLCKSSGRATEEEAQATAAKRCWWRAAAGGASAAGHHHQPKQPEPGLGLTLGGWAAGWQTQQAARSLPGWLINPRFFMQTDCFVVMIETWLCSCCLEAALLMSQNLVYSFVLQMQKQEYASFGLNVMNACVQDRPRLFSCHGRKNLVAPCT